MLTSILYFGLFCIFFKIGNCFVKVERTAGQCNCYLLREQLKVSLDHTATDTIRSSLSHRRPYIKQFSSCRRTKMGKIRYWSPNIWKAEAGELQVQGHLELHSETLSIKALKKKKEKKLYLLLNNPKLGKNIQ